MMHVLASCLLALSLFHMPAKPTVIERVLRSLVVVESVVDGEDHYCTGFVVNAAGGEVLTAAHCIPASGEQLTVDRVASHVLKATHTLALLASVPMAKPPLDIRSVTLPVGEHVLSFGYGYGLMMVFNRNVANAREGDIGLDGPLAPGMSGGPIVDLDGKVVGLNQKSDNILGVACGQDEIRAFLKR